MIPVKGYAAFDAETPLKPWSFERREPDPGEVLIDIRWCGVCHSDVHLVKNDLGGTRYPLVPGHEIVGTVAKVGEGVTRFRPGDRVGVGCMVDSCRHCDECAEGLEQYCDHMVPTYGGTDKHDQPTQGGYSTKITVDQDFVLTIPAAIPLEKAAPLLCAGITTWSPLKHWKAGRGTRVAVIGLGGLGHMAVQLAVALGCEVTVISTSDRKKTDAQRFGAHDFLISKDRDAMRAARGRFDLILNTVSAAHEIGQHVGLLARDGTMVMLGLTTEALHVNALPLIARRRSVAGSLIGGVRETQEMLDFCAEHGIAAEVETIRPDGINQAYERMLKSDVRYRFVIDLSAM
ncbi:NAD(P)-dependent alcohol dehydrogenase [Caulobacter sp. 17J65-9]|uniref:alcohol dehydrogenase catalytic domain-containing protein n=1 Tax=Caulobacter sp. 17J65-9 TaxID=2709382 RepID=UPI0013C9B6C0|nr:NAD(P)-dependent alcohol dehydrogenase [Caulobacter sp. 17J65-9]